MKKLNMKKILIFNSGSFLYGAEKGLINIVKALKDNYEITVVLPRRGPLLKFLQAHGVEIKIFPLGVLAFSFSPFYYLRYFFLTLLDFVYFSIYTHFERIDLLYTNNALIIFPALVASFLGKRHIWHIREFFQVQLVNKIISILARRFSSGIICQSKNIKNILFPDTESNIKVIYEGLNPDGYNNYFDRETQLNMKLNIPKDGVILSIISRIHPLKGQYEFIKSMAGIYKELEREVFVLIVGDVSPATMRNYIYKKRIERLIKKNRLEDRILFLGFREDIERILSFSDICVFPFKRNEPFGLALLEALAFSRQVFLNLNPGSEEIAYFFKDRCKRLSLDLLKETINKGRFGIRKVYLPGIFSFENYKGEVLSFIRERTQ